MGCLGDQGMGAYRELLVWGKAMALTEAIYRATSSFPACERQGLVVELRRGSMAICSSIAAHYTTRGTTFLRGLLLAQRRLVELEHYVWLAERLHYWPARRGVEITQRVEDIERLLCAMLPGRMRRARRA